MEEKNVKPFGMKDKLGYMFGDFGNDFTFIFASSYVLVFYTKVMGVSAGLVGTMFLLARFVDAFTDIGMGRIVDTSKTAKDGRFRCWIRRMMGPVAVASFLMYQAGLQNASMTVKVIYMFVTYLLWGSVFYTSINIPYGSMASVISNKPEDRSSLSVFRSLGGMFAGIFISVITPMIVYTTDANGNTVVVPGNFTLIAGIFSVCAILCYLLCYFLKTERVKIEPKVDTEKVSLGQSLKEVFTSRALLGVVLSALLMLLASLMTQGLNTYLFTDYFNNAGALSIFSMIGLPVALIMATCSTKICLKYGKREMSALGCIFAGIVYCIMGFLHVTDVKVFIILAFFAMLGMYFFQMQCYALVTDVIDDKEVRTGNRDDGTIYGVYSFARKIGQAIAGGLSGWALTAIGYDELAAVQTQTVKDGIYSVSTFFPGIVYILCALTLFFIYPLSKSRVESNVAELKKRRGEA